MVSMENLACHDSSDASPNERLSIQEPIFWQPQFPERKKKKSIQMKWCDFSICFLISPNEIKPIKLILNIKAAYENLGKLSWFCIWFMTSKSFLYKKGNGNFWILCPRELPIGVVPGWLCWFSRTQSSRFPRVAPSYLHRIYARLSHCY